MWKGPPLEKMDTTLLKKSFRMRLITPEESPFLSIGYTGIQDFSQSLKFTMLAFKCERINLILYVG